MIGLFAGAVALFPGGVSLWGFVAQACAAIARCKPCLWAIGTIALCGWTAIHVHRADVVSCTGRIEDEHRQAEVARVDRDKSVAADLEKRYRPQISQLAALNATLQKKVEDARKQKPAAPGVLCKLGGSSSRQFAV